MDLDNRWEAVLDPGKATDCFTLAEPPHFDPTVTSWDLGQAWWLAELSRVIYRTDGRDAILRCSTVKEYVEIPGGGHFLQFEKMNLQFYAAIQNFLGAEE